MDNAKENQLDFYNALDSRFTENQRFSIFSELEKLLTKERREAPEFKFSNYGEITSRDFNNRFFPYFKAHNNLINEFYAPPNDSVFQLSDKSFVDELLAYLLGLETATASDYKINDHSCDKIFAAQPLANNPKNSTKLLNDVTYFLIGQHPIIQQLHKIIRGAIIGDVKSPFSIVNTRARCIKPNMPKSGAYLNHTDMFLPGHLKIMVYLNPMNKDYGYLVVNENEIIDRPKGTCVLFRNSDIEHRGVHGKIYERFCLEVTIQRTFVNLKQRHDGHPIGRHYASLNVALTNDSDGEKIILRT